MSNRPHVVDPLVLANTVDRLLAQRNSHAAAESPPSVLRDAALEYAQQEIPVFPVWGVDPEGRCRCGATDCRDPGKHPISKHGFHDATTDRAPITHWWTRDPDANIGVPTSWCVVLDVDVRPDKRGDVTLANLEAVHGALPPTLEVRTGSGGRHLYFQKPDEIAIPNSTSKVGPGLDIKATGGYVVAPPSKHKSGPRYAWLNRLPLAEMPAWLIDLAIGLPAKERTQMPNAHFPPTATAPFNDLFPGLGEPEEASGSLPPSPPPPVSGSKKWLGEAFQRQLLKLAATTDLAVRLPQAVDPQLFGSRTPGQPRSPRQRVAGVLHDFLTRHDPPECPGVELMDDLVRRAADQLGRYDGAVLSEGGLLEEEWQVIRSLEVSAPQGIEHEARTFIAHQQLVRTLIMASENLEKGAALDDIQTSLLEEVGRTATNLPALAFTPLGTLLAEPDEENEWLVEDRLPTGGLSILGGKVKVGKSTLARVLALAVARGTDWLGFPVKRPGAVWYFALQEKRSQVKKHFQAMGATDHDDIRIVFGPVPANGLAQLKTLAKDEPPALIIIDTLWNFIRVRDSNDYNIVLTALEPLLALARATGAHVLVVHHLRKADDEILGSTAIVGTVDTILKLERHRPGRDDEGQEEYRTLKSEQRYGNDLEAVTLNLDPTTKHVTVGVAKTEALKRGMATRIVDFLAQQAPQAVKEAEIIEAIGGDTGRAKTRLRELVAENRVVRLGEGGKKDPYRYGLPAQSAAPPGLTPHVVALIRQQAREVRHRLQSA